MRPVPGLLRGSGQPLDAPVREEMEARLGADFSQVRVHTDRAARASAAGVGARAYTVGNHMVIGDGGADKHILAHELTHVIQQREGQVAGTDHGNGLKVSNPFDAYEKAAEANAARVMRAPLSQQRLTAAETGEQGTPAVHSTLVIARMISADQPEASTSQTTSGPADEEPTFRQAWGKKIDALTEKDGLLDPTSTSFSNKVKQKPDGPGLLNREDFVALVKKLKDALLDDTAANARKALAELRGQFIAEETSEKASKNTGEKTTQALSVFPTTVEHILLEYINAKLLWESGQKWPMPFKEDIGGTKRHPDYLVRQEMPSGKGEVPSGKGEVPSGKEEVTSGKEEVREYGEHVSVKDKNDLIRAIGREINKKLYAYEGYKLRVVVDVTSSPAVQALIEEDDSEAAWISRIKEAVQSMVKNNREKLLTQVNLILPHKIITFRPGEPQARD
jgi:hypothetical protein